MRHSGMLAYAHQQDGSKKYHIVPRKEVMREAALRGFSTATDLADYLVRNGVAFRDAHEIVGKSVAARNHIGGTAPERVREAARVAREVLDR